MDGDAAARGARRGCARPDRRPAVHRSRLALQAIGLAWIAAVSEPTVGYGSFVGPFILSGIGMGMFFAPVANIVLSAVRRDEEGKASGANNAIREAECSVWPCSRRSSRATAATSPPRPSTTGWFRRSGSARSSWRSVQRSGF